MIEYAREALALIKQHWPDAEHVVDPADGRCWVRLRSYPVPPGWTAKATAVVFVIPNQAGVAPYGFYVPRTLMISRDGQTIVPMSHYTQVASGVPGALAGEWAMFSWAPMQWGPQDNIVTFVRSFRERLEGLE